MEIHYSSKKHTWETPKWLFEELNDIFNFNLDACAEKETAKCEVFYTKEDNALLKQWNGTVWCNPPYGKEQIEFINKAYKESIFNGATVVLLIPARPDTKVWQNVIFKTASQVCFMKGRLKFEGAKHNAPFPCALVTFGKSKDLSKYGFLVDIGDNNGN